MHHEEHQKQPVKHDSRSACWNGGWNPANTPAPPSITRCRACGSFEHVACSEVKFWVGQRVRTTTSKTSNTYQNLTGTVVKEEDGDGIMIELDNPPDSPNPARFRWAMERVEPLPQAQQQVQVAGAQVFSVGQRVRVKPKEQLSAEFAKTFCNNQGLEGISGIVIALDQTFENCACLKVKIGETIRGEWYIPTRDLIPEGLPPGAYVVQACGCTGTTHVGTCSNFPKLAFRVPQYPTPLPPSPQEPCDTCGLTAPCFCKGLSLHATMPVVKEWEFPQVHP